MSPDKPPVSGSGSNGDGSSLDDVPEEEVEELEKSVDTDSLDEEELVSLDDAARALLARPRRGHGPLSRLYRGETRFDFVGRRKIWFSISTAIILLGIISIVLRGGLNLGIDFKGGYEWTIQAPGVTQTQATNALKGTGVIDPTVQLLGRGGQQTINVQSDMNKLSQDQQTSGEHERPEGTGGGGRRARAEDRDARARHHDDHRQGDDDHDGQGGRRRGGIHHDLGTHDDDHVAGQQRACGRSPTRSA